MPTAEDAFLHELQLTPGRREAWAVYADWLEEKGDPRSAYLRALCQLDPQADPRAQPECEQLRAGLDPYWLQLIDDLRLQRLYSLDLVTLSALSELRGLLHAFALVNDRSDAGHLFTAHLIPVGTHIEQSLARFFAAESPTLYCQATPHWRVLLSTALRTWLFAYVGELRQAKLMAQHDRFREEVLRKVMHQIESLVRPKQAWQVHFHMGIAFANTWEKLVLEGADRLLILQFRLRD